jgi:hypothetical protein
LHYGLAALIFAAREAGRTGIVSIAQPLTALGVARLLVARGRHQPRNLANAEAMAELPKL